MIFLLFFERDQDQDQLEESVSFIDLSLDSALSAISEDNCEEGRIH